MTTLVMGASGATGRHLVNQLLLLNRQIKIIVRPEAAFPREWNENKNVRIIKANISEIDENKMAEYLSGCDSVASCLGHNITLKGIFGKPRKLVTDAVALVYRALEKSSVEKPVKFVLMNTTANRNKDLNERETFKRRIIIGIIRQLVPPQSDNENAADYLRVNVGKNNNLMEWVIVRPDALINEDAVSDYELFPSPVSDPVFKPGKTSRINVGYLMAVLIADNVLWEKWKGSMPVIYNKTT